MIKRYISLNSLHLTTTIKVNKKEQTIVFSGGSIKPSRINGSLITDSADLQIAIETDSSYGKSFISDNSEINYNPEKRTNKVPKKNNLTDIENVNSPQMAIEWIRKNLSIELNNNSTNRDIKKLAASQGYNLPNLAD